MKTLTLTEAAPMIYSRLEDAAHLSRARRERALRCLRTLLLLALIAWAAYSLAFTLRFLGL